MALASRPEVYTPGMDFVWDTKKAASNRTKHGVGFEEASTVFLDPLSATGADPDHSRGESRWLTFGVSAQGNFWWSATATMATASVSSVPG